MTSIDNPFQQNHHDGSGAGRKPAPIRVSWLLENGEKVTERFCTPPVRIGRDYACEICVKDGLVSRQHAELYHDGAQWCVRDLRSRNGTYLDGIPTDQAPLPGKCTLQLGPDGPIFWLELESATERRPLESMADVADHYFRDSQDKDVGAHTLMIRRTFQALQKKQSKRYQGVIAAVAILLVASIGFGTYQYIKLQKAREVAIDIFYHMKSVSLQVAKIEEMVRKTGDATLLAEISNKRRQVSAMEAQYDNFLEELGILGKDMSEEDRIILRIARLFGECELNMPRDFSKEVKRYIAKWKRSDRLQKAIRIIEKNGHTHAVYEAMIANHLPPQFLYLALQESGFNPKAVGPKTRFGFAKGVWQFIPATARHYGLRTGPLVELPVYDPKDERYNFELATEAAADFIRDIYNTDAQASGLLVMASYNWGPTNMRKRIRRMPENPRDRNFWKLLKQHKIPKETYDYVFYIISATVIGENPRLFGFDFDNPLQNLGTQ